MVTSIFVAPPKQRISSTDRVETAVTMRS